MYPSKEKATSPKQSSDLRIRSFNAPLMQRNELKGVPPNAFYQKNPDQKVAPSLEEMRYLGPKPLQEVNKI